MRNLLFGVVVSIFMIGCSTLQVQVDYDPKYDFKSNSNFSVVYAKKSDNRDLARSRISKALKSYIIQKGYTSVEKSNADFYFTVHLDVQTKSQVETNYENMSIRPRFYDGYWNNNSPFIDVNRSYYPYERDMRVTTNTYEYDEGKLIIEVFDVKKQEVVWQGIAKDEISAEYTQEEMSAYINKVIEKLFKDFPNK
ncbi:DUF4136 domain-containing protein [Candidatus Sulfurimonas marisnigri]|uniref:DUF4136 domain-containing protein n=1 Tax=Candidatus Sulfurimonas marisnigri TaxID=2740405 RepID=A0A7S7RQB2_9BACT|nr:DUF4136 domain-containing protein [Candidatus Sulfurimonas marisnigri]QOY54434.1 DUF4136 domain-containing protein [Candidatus Sulfurimonas marisnigri]